MKKFQKPCKKVYLERMLLTLNIKGVNIGQLTYKIKELKSSNDNAVQWHNKTGQGVKTGDIRGKDFFYKVFLNYVYLERDLQFRALKVR